MKPGTIGLWLMIFMMCFTSVATYSQELGSQDNQPVTDQVTTETSKIYKANLENSISLGPRIGNFIWQGQVYSTTANRNGIRGNFIFNGPTIPGIGIGARFGITKLIRIAPSLDFTFDDYVYRADLGRAFQTQSITGKAVGPVATVMGLLLSVPVWFDFNLSERVVFSLAPGLSFYPRIALLPIDNSTDIDLISAYLNKDLRWFYPQTGISIKYSLDTTTTVGFEMQLMYPIWQLWSENLSIFDGMILTGFFGLDFYF